MKEEGDSLVEYAILIALISIVAIGSIALFGQLVIQHLYDLISEVFQ